MKKTAQKPTAQTKPALFGLDRKDLKLVHGGRGVVITAKLGYK